MKKIIFLIYSLLPFFLFAQTSIYDIQYTTIAGDGSYPSLLNGEYVTTGGIVTANNFNGGRYFIASSAGGAWNGIFIYDNMNAPEIGDSIIISGEVYEYEGMTEIKSLTSFDVVSTSNPLPPAAEIPSAQIWDEAWEGVFVQVNNCTATEAYDTFGNYTVDDGSGESIVRSGMYDMMGENIPLFEGYPFNFVRGIVHDYYGRCLLPRFRNDLQTTGDAFIIATEDQKIDHQEIFSLPVQISLIGQSASINSWELNLMYDEAIFQYEGYSLEGSISEGGNISDYSTSGEVRLSFSGDALSSDIQNLVQIHLSALGTGLANLQFDAVKINGNSIPWYQAGILESGIIDCDKPKADTLSTIQRPLMGIPSIVKPGQQLEIQCLAPAGTTSWDAKLMFQDIFIDLNIINPQYNARLQKWTMQATIPETNCTELYDLIVTASGGIVDTVANSVKIIDEYKNQYYFIHITDTHLPGHTFWGDPGYENDDTEMANLREVIKDINLLNPEFVLFTGDVLNEGEMEDFECLRHHTKVIKLLETFDVPVYIVPGNHDLGGWESTPPEQGTSRREWWRFFGQRQPQIPPVQEEYYVNDYSFDYGNVHFTGMEASDNYDGYLYEIYGEKGFIPQQMEWLENDLAAAGNKTKVLFYHYDFKNQIDLNALGIDMTLWGHTHSDTDDFTHPYNIGTNNICDDEEAYRIIRVNNSELRPENTVYTRGFGQNLSISFSVENNGSHDSISATIINKHNQEFNHALVKFLMPAGDDAYNVRGGKLQQIVKTEGKNICYVSLNLKAQSEQTTSINIANTGAIAQQAAEGSMIQVFPNPFKENIRFDFECTQAAEVQLQICDLQGRIIYSLANRQFLAGQHTIHWSGRNAHGQKISAGIYFCKLMINGKQVASRKLVKQ